MDILLLGIGIGLLTLIPPGPISLTLMQVGARHGRQPALRGALGVATGDTVLGVVAVVIVGLGATVPALVFTSAQVASAGLLIALGAILLANPEIASTSVDRIERPARALFLLTSLTPTALGAWIALLAAMPFASDVAQLSRFAFGVVISSFLWHPVLGALASTLSNRLGKRGHLRLSRFGGLSMGLLGLILGAQQFS